MITYLINNTELAKNARGCAYLLDVAKSLRAFATSVRELCPAVRSPAGLRTSGSFAKCKTLRKAPEPLAAIATRHSLHLIIKTMRVTLIIATIFTSSIFAFGQETSQDTSKKEFKNVIGIDATNFVSRFFNFSSTSSYFNSPYVISYRRIFKNNALRVGIGGNFQNNEGTLNDTLHPSTKRISLNLGVGFEHYCYLSKRWNFYVGAEAFTGYSYYDDISYPNPYSSSSYREQSYTSYSFGVSPLIGVQFKINSRLSISTESSYNIAYVIDKSFGIQSPTTINDTHFNSSGIKTSFYPPTAITFRIQL